MKYAYQIGSPCKRFHRYINSSISIRHRGQPLPSDTSLALEPGALQGRGVLHRAVTPLSPSVHQHVLCSNPLPRAGINRLGCCRNKELTGSPQPQPSQGLGHTTRITSQHQRMEMMGLSYRKRAVLAKIQLCVSTRGVVQSKESLFPKSSF